MLREEDLTSQIIGAAIDVHRELGPGLLESAYEACLCFELNLRKMTFARQVPLPVVYKGLQIECGYRADIIVANKAIVEVKAVDEIVNIHKARLLTYLRVTGLKVGLILNFKEPVLKNGIVRLVL
jgi:GxxExxY protein